MQLYPVFCILYYWKNWNAGIIFREIAEIVVTLNKVPFLGATWFLSSLFWVSVLTHFICRALERFKWCDFALLFTAVMMACIGFHITLPYKQSRTCICMLFYVLGYLYKKHLRDRIGNRLQCILAVLGIIIFYNIVNHNASNMSENYYEHKILFVVGAVLASYALLWIAGMIMTLGMNRWSVRHIVYIGRNSLTILIWHFMANRFAILLQIIMLKLPLSTIAAFPVYNTSGWWWIVYFITGLYGAIIWGEILRHNMFSLQMKRLGMIR